MTDWQWEQLEEDRTTRLGYVLAMTRGAGRSGVRVRCEGLALEHRATGCKTPQMDGSALDEGATVRGLLFDLGGVVIDIDFERVFRFWAARAACDPAELRRRFAFDQAYEQHERGELVGSECFTVLQQSLRLRLSEDDVIAGWNDIYLGAVRGMTALLAAANQRFPLYAFTNSNPTHKSVWSVRFANELCLFRSVFVSSELGLRKPDPEAFTVVAGLTGFLTSEILLFDDTPENVDGARSTGMQAVLVESTTDVRGALRGLGLEVPSAGRFKE